MAYILDGYEFEFLPAPGGYSGWNPQRVRADVQTLSSVVSMDWGIVEEDVQLVLESPWVRREEWLSIQARAQAEDAYGVPKRYTFEDPDRDYEVEIVTLEGHPYHQHLNAGVRLVLRVLSVGT